MNLSETIQSVYDYHYWANRRSMEAAARIDADRLHDPLGHSWGSIFSILLHMRHAEWIWLQRWQGISPTGFPNEAHFPNLEVLRFDWLDLERQMRAFVAQQDEASLNRMVAYQNTRGVPGQMLQWQMLLHVANHATHHRGELAAAFALAGIEHEEEDMSFYFSRL